MRRITVEWTVDKMLDSFEDRRLNKGMELDLPGGLVGDNIEQHKAMLLDRKEGIFVEYMV